MSRKPLLNVHYTGTVRSFCHCSSAGWLCPCQTEGGAILGQENTEPRAFEMARHWVADFWVVHHLGRAPMRLVRAHLGCAQMGNAVKDQCHSERRSVEPRIMWVVAAWVGTHLGCALQRVALVYRRAKKWRSTGYKPKIYTGKKKRKKKEMFTFSEMLALFRVGKEFRCLRLS